MLCLLDPSTVEADLDSGAVSCPHRGCDGQLGPWGHARTRRLRLRRGQTQAHTPRRARCRTCRRTQVLHSPRSYPRRPDTAETVATALLAAAEGLSHRRVAEQVDLPATTVRGWIRRAKTNSETVRVDATIATYTLDPGAGPFGPTRSPLGDMLDAVGRSVAAYISRVGTVADPWHLTVALTGGGILAPRPGIHWGHTGPSG